MEIMYITNRSSSKYYRLFHFPIQKYNYNDEFISELIKNPRNEKEWELIYVDSDSIAMYIKSMFISCNTIQDLFEYDIGKTWIKEVMPTEGGCPSKFIAKVVHKDNEGIAILQKVIYSNGPNSADKLATNEHLWWISSTEIYIERKKIQQ